MEEHKHRALIHFLKRCKKPIELIFHCMDQVVEELRDSYNFESLYDSVPDDCAHHNDPVYGKPGKLYFMPYIKSDMLMLENQLPMRVVLHTLIEVETDTAQFITRQILISCSNQINHKLRDMSFFDGVLRLPTFVVGDTTEYMLLNLVAFQRLHVGASNEITSYVFFIGTVIDDGMDMAILHRKRDPDQRSPKISPWIVMENLKRYRENKGNSKSDEIGTTTYDRGQSREKNSVP
ncbi:hypothetical protein JHK85_005693 [Glycine max]|nr:hypothetical protein JHK85_005693 [Glycine max]KAG5081473.1 hypothetical protein JHK86_005538 [Glycine max]